MTQPLKYHVTVIGCGKMGSAMIQGWLKKSLLNHINIVDPKPPPKSITQAESAFHVKQAADLNLNDTDLVTLAVKPQIMDYICDELKERLNKDVPILSIAAGKDIAYFEKHFSVNQPIIRAMPNLPATIGQGMSVIVANKAVTDAHKQMVETLLSANGKTLWIEDESKMDAVTALSGSGPAYLFYFIEALAEAGQTIGLSEEEAMTLAKQTIIGASALVDASENEEPSELREAVTSKAGTTESALKVLMDGKFQAVLNEALKAAKERSQELSL